MSGAASSDADERVRRVLGDLADHERARGPLPRFERFELIDAVGHGATSTVYRARDLRLGRTVAVKLLRDGFGAADEVARERFRREASAAAALSHPNVVALHDAGEEGGRPYLVMELVEGRTLAAAFADADVDVPSRLRLLEKAARGVAAAHAAGIVHRDLKPGNILLGADGEPKVGDFGLAHLLDGRSELTRTGTSVGTPLYMAPEQVEGRTSDVSPRTDVYALGAILHEALTGRPPFESPSLADLYRKILHDDPPPPPGDAGTVAAKAMEKDPARRYADAAEFADDLRRAIDGEPIQARPVGPLGRLRRRLARHRWAVALAVAAALVLAGLSLEAWRARRELHRVANPNPWLPVFDGTSTACFLGGGGPGWRLEGGALVGSLEKAGTLQTDRVFEDADVRVRFSFDRLTWLGISIRLGTKRGYSVELDRGALNPMAGSEHELVFSCRGDDVRATLDGRPAPVVVYHPSRRGTLHLSLGGGPFRLLGIDYRSPE